ncbi:uncharacterized protein PHACADRAFT_198080 [Phanerochaete carnosa HHB-10118-sp]|uniref:EamA domain-containing protein n=1 Tax=Phanerochaete carnosa (strain HHB-10118-sp) TaxID=650164 RepID=K5VQA2_PHACS|nr:uncharacterized protein PHACADRAFT_198080 [Phanerochaete carnosa HHB-10118-sp]EKM53658.1 hypothetical protein PHACADRAFT_198080 [Phanerochaete carnosa HHB-10118-sp]
MDPTRIRRWPSEYTIGILLLVTVVCLWTIGSFVAQEAFDTGFRKPFWITYLNSSTFILYLIPCAIKHVMKKYGIRAWGSKPDSHGHYQSLPMDGKDEFVSPDTQPFTTKETFRLALSFAFPYFALNWAIVVSLSLTSVTSSTILGSTVGIFTLLLARLFRIEALTPTKFLAVATSFIGVILVSISDSSPGSTEVGASSSTDAHTDPAPILGDLLALVGAAIGALYLVLFKRRVRDESRVNTRLMFGFIGALISVSMLPVGLLLHLLHVERFALPSGGSVVFALLTSMLVTVIGDMLYFMAMMKTTPVVASVGQSLIMPFAIAGDFFLHGSASILAILGCVVVLASFGVLGLDSRKEVQREKGSESIEPIEDGAMETGCRTTN